MDNEKTCKDCGLTKSSDNFSKDKSKKSGLATYCKPCALARYQKYYAKNSGVMKERSRQWYADNTDRHKENSRAWREANRDTFLEYRKDYFQRRYSNDDKFRINCIIRAMLLRVLQASGKEKDFCTFQTIGYDHKKLIDRISCQFEKGMSWGNYGDWEIDHRIPVSVMIERGEVRPNVINALCNLKPMWKEGNRAKGARWIG